MRKSRKSAASASSAPGAPLIEGMIVTLNLRRVAICVGLKNFGAISATSSATAVSSFTEAAAVGVRFSGAGGTVGSSAGGAGEAGAGLLLAGAVVCCAINAGASGAAAIAL